MWKRNDEEMPQPSPANPAPAARPAAEPRRTGSGRAVIGESIRVEGEISGDEDLLIEGEVEGRVTLDKQSVTVGRNGRVKADIHGHNLVVEGKVQGNLFAHEQVVVRTSGEVRGNITAPRVTLEDGAKFKGAIDMEPRKVEAARSTAAAVPGKPGNDKGGKSASGAGGGGDTAKAGDAAADKPGAATASGSGKP
jgi:cytoskeletal protein CcmA (bactofilin family)